MASKWKLLPSFSTAKEATSEQIDLRRPKITSRIVRAFSRTSAAKQFFKQTGPMFSLPYELLEQIYDLIQSKRDLCNLRRTCTQLNGHLEARVLEELVIDSVRRGSYSTGQLLKALSTGKASCSSYTTTLQISNMLIFSSSTQTQWQDPNIDSRLQPLQEQYIVPAFKALRNVRRITWNLKIKDPYSVIADGLVGGSTLEELHIIFDHWVPTSVFPVDRFSNLSVLALEAGDYPYPISNGTVMSLRKALQASPKLVDLRLGIAIDQNPTLDDIFPETPTVPAAKIQLTHLRALDEYWHSFRGSWDVISNLTSIDLPNVSDVLTSSIWAAFKSKQVRLVSISVDNMSLGLVRYLQGYLGLQRLHVKRAVDLSQDIASQFFLKVLKQHHQSVTTFILQLNPHRRTAGSQWTLRLEYLASILGCPMVAELALPVQYSNEPTIGVSELLHSLAPLQHLQHLHICPVMDPPGSVALGLAMVDDVRNVEISSLDTFRFDIQLFSSCFRATRKDVEGRRVYYLKEFDFP